MRLAAVSGIALLSIGLLAAPAQAAATTGVASVSGTKVIYKAAKKKQNRVVLTRSGNTVTVDDKVAVKPGKGCRKVDRTKVRCTLKKAPTRLNVYTYDRNDTVVNKTGLGMFADGGSGNDAITGGPGQDKLRGGDGKDRLWGLAGKDFLSGGDGNDRVSGGDGDDDVDGGEGHDVVYGNNGDDYVDGWIGNDRLYGGAGADTLGFAEYEVEGASDNDLYSGGSGHDTLAIYFHYDHGVRVDTDGVADDGRSGEKDNILGDLELIYGTDRNDRISAGPGRSTLIGGKGDDVLYGNGGDDVLIGGPGNDTVDGGAGNDHLSGESGADVVRGGSGTDTVSYSDHVKPVVVDLDGAKGDDGQAGEKDSVGADVENLHGGPGNDRLTGNAAANEISGYDGNDVIRGGAGNDLLDGGNGQDRVFGEAGDDNLDGQDRNVGNAVDLLDGGPDSDYCRQLTGDTLVSCELTL
jgi:Ca2+-binding RTX toxin-like protein